MNKEYVIGWKCQTNGRIGQSKIVMTFEKAQKLAGELNKAHPDYKHMPVPVATKPHELSQILTSAFSPGEVLVSPMAKAGSEAPEEPAALALAQVGGAN